VDINKIKEDMLNNQGIIKGVVQIHEKVIAIDRPIAMVKIGNQYHFTFMVHEDKIDKS
jgi:hypothetical protein